jgi:hypothetical protein
MRAFAIVLASLLCSGCFAFEEIDKGYELMEAHSPVKKPGEEPEPTAQAKARPDPRAQWWATATTLEPRSADGDDPLVSCRLGGGTRFTRRSDCLTRGGSVAD